MTVLGKYWENLLSSPRDFSASINPWGILRFNKFTKFETLTSGSLPSMASITLSHLPKRLPIIGRVFSLVLSIITAGPPLYMNSLNNAATSRSTLSGSLTLASSFLSSSILMKNLMSLITT